MKFSIKDFLCKCKQMRSNLIQSFLIENFFFCAEINLKNNSSSRATHSHIQNPAKHLL